MHDQRFEAVAREAFAMAMAVAMKRRIPYEVCRDIAQQTVVDKCDILVTEGWREHIGRHAETIMKKVVDEHKEQEDMKTEYVDPRERRSGCEDSKQAVMDIATEALTPREWQVVHRRVWHDKTFDEIGKDIEMTADGARKAWVSGLLNLRQAMRRLGINRATWRRWYYDGEL